MSRGSRRPAARLGGQELPLGSVVLEQAAQAERAEYLRRRAELAPLPPVAERSSMAEKAWQKQVVALATRLGFYVYHPQLSRWSARGWPDLSLLGSRALWIECKDDGGQLTEPQVEVIGRMRSCGLEAYVLRPWHGLDRVAAILQFTGQP
jgi:hypothetical protein